MLDGVVFCPWLSSGEDEVSRLDQSSHDGDDDGLGRLSFGDEPVGEGFEGGIAPLGAERGWIDQWSRPVATAADETLAFELAGVFVEWSDAQEGRGLTALHLARFRHTYDQADGDDGPGARQGDQALVRPRRSSWALISLMTSAASLTFGRSSERIWALRDLITSARVTCAMKPFSSAAWSVICS